MKNPHDCVPKGTVPLVEFQPALPPLMKARGSSFNNDIHWDKNTHEITRECGLFRCNHVGFRVPSEKADEFKY